jgi:hypothetical protein
MRKQVVAIAIASALSLCGGAFAQEVKGPMMEAVVTVTKVDPANRMVWVEAKSAKRTLHLPPDIDMSNLQVGSRYQIRYQEAVATAVEPGGSAAAGATREIEKTGKGTGVSRAKVAGKIESLEGKKLTLRTADGQETFMIGEGVSPASFKTGDTVTVSYQRPLAAEVRSTPQPVSDPAPAQ